jgi:hypothetical protein
LGPSSSTGKVLHAAGPGPGLEIRGDERLF